MPTSTNPSGLLATTAPPAVTSTCYMSIMKAVWDRHPSTRWPHFFASTCHNFLSKRATSFPQQKGYFANVARAEATGMINEVVADDELEARSLCPPADRMPPKTVRCPLLIQ